MRHLSALNAKGIPANLQGLGFLIVPSRRPDSSCSPGYAGWSGVRSLQSDSAAQRRGSDSCAAWPLASRPRWPWSLRSGLREAMPRTATPAFAAPASLANIGVLLLCFIVQAGAEEILFRGWMLSAVARKFNVATGIAFTTAVFALLHFDRQSPWHDVLLSVLFSVFACLWRCAKGASGA